MKKMLVMFAAAGLMLAACGKKNPPAEPTPPAADGSATAPAEGEGSAMPAPEGDGSAAPAAEGGAEAPAGG
jgi:hypothetical protein